MALFSALIPVIFLSANSYSSEFISEVSAVSGNVYYVSDEGSDSNSGSEALPFRTIQYAVDSVEAGDTIYVRAGIYHENVIVNRSGTSSRPIRIMAYPNELPVIDGQYSLPNGDAVNCSDVQPYHCFVYSPLVLLRGSHLEFSGFKIIRSRGRGIGVTAPSSRDTVSNILINGCIVDGTRNAAINIQDAEYITVQSCDVSHGADFATHARSASHLNWPVIVNIIRADNVTVQRSRIHENWGEGIAAGRDSTNIRIEDNIIFDNYALQVYVHRSQNVIVQRNLIYHTNEELFRRGGNPSECIVVNNESNFVDSLVTHGIEIKNNVVAGCGRGIAIWGNAGTNILTQDVAIANNTIVKPVKNTSAEPVSIFVNPRVPLRNIDITKNIVLQNYGTLASVPNSNEVQLNSNLWSSTPDENVLSQMDYVGDPILVNPHQALEPGEVQVDWFKAKANSPAISRGMGPTEYLNQTSLNFPPFINLSDDNQIPVPTTVPILPPDSSVDIYQPSAFYSFNETGGARIPDESQSQAPIDLYIEDETAVIWKDRSLVINSPTIIYSSGNEENLMNICSEANQFSISLWITPDNVVQDGPARILSFSNGTTQRNFMLGQGLWNNLPKELLTVRLRTTQTNDNGEPSLDSPTGTIRPQKHHIVYSRDKNQNSRLYIDGQVQASDSIAGDLSNWDSSYQILLANEASRDRPWLGSYHQLAIYCGSLTDENVTTLFSLTDSWSLSKPNQPNFSAKIFLPLIDQ